MVSFMNIDVNVYVGVYMYTVIIPIFVIIHIVIYALHTYVFDYGYYRWVWHKIPRRSWKATRRSWLCFGATSPRSALEFRLRESTA